MATANLVIRFITELAGIAALAYAGFQLPGPLVLRIVVAVAAAATLIGAWWLVVAPNAANALTQPQKDLIGTCLLLLAAAALGLAWQPQLAIGFAAVIIVNSALLFVFGPEARESLERMGR